MNRLPRQPSRNPARPANRPVYRYTQQYLQEAGRLQRATWGPRVVATLVDFAIIAIPFNILGSLFWLEHTYGASSDEATGAAYSAGITVGLPLPLHNLLWIVVFALYASLTTLRFGATPGKRWMNLKVIKDNGENLNLRNLLSRYSFIYISNLPILVFIIITFLIGINWGYILAGVVLVIDFGYSLRDSQNKTFHDKLFGTQVIIADVMKI